MCDVVCVCVFSLFRDNFLLYCFGLSRVLVVICLIVVCLLLLQSSKREDKGETYRVSKRCSQHPRRQQ